MQKFCLPILFSIFLSSCGVQKIIVHSTTPILENTLASLNEENDPELAKISIASNLKLLEGFLKSDPKNEKLILFATFGYTSYSLGFVEEENPEAAKNLYLRAKNYGFQILTKNKNFAKANSENNPENFQKSLKNFSKKNIEAVFWTANAWASYINLSRDDPEAVSELWKAQSLMERCLELDENFYFAGPHLFLGTIKASLPKLLGGKPEEAKNHFEKALKLSNEKMQMIRVFYAQFYAVQLQDKELFESQLKQVLAFDVENAPEIRLINTLAKKRAKKLLEDIDTYF